MQSMVVAADSKIDFTRDIRPILSNACFHCHGPDEDSRQADLRLDQRESLFADTDGQRIVAPGNPDDSELIRRILSHDTDEVMPPADSNKTVTDQQRQMLVDWVKQGAEWRQHWAFERPVAVQPPSPKINNWCRNDIDRFVLAKMEAAGLQPSPQAAPHTLLRRLYLDLTGLPPTIEQADKWLARIWGQDHASSLVESEWQLLIDELMASSHYGERWARRWLDLARYADTNGYEKDRDRSIWPYRDWVVNAINSDMPFDRFTVEQLAGDMLPNATLDQRVATGFHRNTMLNEEGGIDPLEFRYHAVTDRVATTGTTWLGLTLGCCQCHTHKYDPISHHEYFQVFAFLNNADEPYLELDNAKAEKEFESNQQKAQALLAKLPQQWPVVESELVASQILNAEADGSQNVNVVAENTVEVSGANPNKATYVVELKPEADFDSLKLISQSMGDHPGPGRTDHGNFVLSEVRVEAVGPNQNVEPISITRATASVEQDGYAVEKAFDGRLGTGWAIHSDQKMPRTATAVFELNTGEIDLSKAERIRVTLTHAGPPKHTIAKFKLQLHRRRSPMHLARLREEKVQAAFEQWVKTQKDSAVLWKPLVPTKATSNLPILTIEDDHSIFASGDTAKRDDYSISLAAAEKPMTAIRLEALPDERLPAGGPGSTYYEGTIGDFYLTEITASAAGRQYRFSSATHSYAKNRYGKNPVSAALSIDGDIQTGWSVHDRQGERHVAVYVLEEPIPAGTAVEINMAFGRHFASSLGRFRFSATSAKTAPIAQDWPDLLERVLTRDSSEWTPEQQNLAFTSWLMTTPELADAAAKIKKLQKKARQTTSLVFSERPPGQGRPTYRHHRGEYLQPKDQVKAALPAVLSGNNLSPGNRLEFARWLVSQKNPLTARVVVNRHWAAFFGTGIVKTIDDFGLQGEYPSHPQLLDWLAVRFSTDDQWSIRKLHRLIASSAVYRQASEVNKQAATVDPDNRLLSYSPRYRLDAEVIRDQLLVAANVLSTKLGGPPVRPPQPAGVTEAAYGKPKWNASSGTDRYRRSLYTYTKRTAPFAMFSTFDAPSGEACVAKRNRSNSPLQALTMLNDVMLLDLSRRAGNQLATQPRPADEKVIQLFRRLLVRRPTPDELAFLVSFQSDQQAQFLANPQAAADMLGETLGKTEAADLAARASWASVARALFGLDESLTRE